MSCKRWLNVKLYLKYFIRLELQMSCNVGLGVKLKPKLYFQVLSCKWAAKLDLVSETYFLKIQLLKSWAAKEQQTWYESCNRAATVSMQWNFKVQSCKQGANKFCTSFAAILVRCKRAATKIIELQPSCNQKNDCSSVAAQNLLKEEKPWPSCKQNLQACDWAAKPKKGANKLRSKAAIKMVAASLPQACCKLAANKIPKSVLLGMHCWFGLDCMSFV